MIDLYWRGADGSLWDLIRGPVRITKDGLTGLLPGPTERRVTSSSKRDGQRRTGGRALPRPVVFPVLVYTAGNAAEWFDIYRAWARSLSDETPGQLIAANTATGQEASLTCAVETWPVDMPQDPSTTRRQKLVYGLVADDPFWYLPTFSQSFESAADVPVNYYGGGPIDQPGFGYPLVRGAGSQAGRVQLDNPGDQPAWWTARFPAPSTGFLVSINGATVAGNYAVPDGAVLEVDSQQATVSVLAQGVREELPWYLLDRVEFAPLPPGGSAEVFVRGTGAGIPSFTFWPRRRDAL